MLTQYAEEYEEELEADDRACADRVGRLKIKIEERFDD